MNHLALLTVIKPDQRLNRSEQLFTRIPVYSADLSINVADYSGDICSFAEIEFKRKSVKIRLSDGFTVTLIRLG